MGGLPHTSPEVHLQNPPSTFPAIILSLFQPRQPRVQGRPLGGATGAVAPGPAPRDERNRTPPPP